MCGGGGGLLGTLSGLLFGKPKAPEMPKIEAPAPPAPSRKTDTGAIVRIGDTSTATDRLSGNATGTGVQRRTGSVLGNLGRGGLSI
jgi:hypothetical protein